MLSAKRVAARFIAETQVGIRDEGAFTLAFLPRHQEAVEPVVALVHKAIDMYRAAGIPIQDKVLVQLNGKGGAHADAMYWNGHTPPLMAIAPKAYKDPILFKTIIHEFGHYTHDKVVPRGTGNPEVVSRYHWAIKQKATGEGPKLDVLRKRIKVLEAELRALNEQKNILRAPPKKGEVFEFDRWANGAKLHFKGRIIKKSGDRVTIEILNPEIIPRSVSGFFPVRNGIVTIDDSLKVLLHQGTDPKVEALIKEKEAERSNLYNEAAGIARTEKDDRYEAQRNEWAPTTYSRKNPMEWFAELCTTYVLGHLKTPVDKWLLSVIKTGEAPADLAL